MSTKSGKSSATDKGEKVLAKNRRDLWKEISSLEKQAVDVLSSESVDGIKSRKEAFKLLSKSVALKKNDAFMILASKYSEAQTQEKTGDNDTEKNRDDDMDILEEMYKVGLPPHLEYIVSSRRIKAGLDQAPVQEEDEEGTVVTEAEAVVDEITGGEKGEIEEIEEFVQCEEVEEESTVSEVITEKVRVRVQSFYDDKDSDPSKGQFMFRYKVAIFNDGQEAVQVVARMWEIERYPTMEKEVIRGAGILQNQPIISPGDVYAYESRCPIKLFPPKGKRVLASMNGAYTVCRGNMGQHNFPVKIGDFNLVIPERVAGGKKRK